MGSPGLGERIGYVIVRIVVTVVIRLHGGNVPFGRVIGRSVSSRAMRASGRKGPSEKTRGLGYRFLDFCLHVAPHLVGYRSARSTQKVSFQFSVPADEVGVLHSLIDYTFVDMKSWMHLFLANSRYGEAAITQMP
jgi:hypothetical protein